MAQTFDIRFARSAGIAAFFEAAGNSLGWKGSGRLSIDAQGMSFARKRGAMALLARRRTQRIPAETIQEIYREGDALRVEFASAEDPRAVLPFWASNREAAAQIVQLAPTSRTFEVESGPTESPAGRKRGLHWSAPVIVFLAIAAATLVIFRRPGTDAAAVSATAAAPVVAPAMPTAEVAPAPDATVSDRRAESHERVETWGEPITPDEARKLAILAEDPVDWTQSPAASAGVGAPPDASDVTALVPAAASDDEAFVPMEVPELELPGDDAVARIAPATLAYRAARELVTQFAAQAAELSDDFRTTRARYDAGDLQAHAFADRLDALAAAWLALNARLLQNSRYADSALEGLRATLISVLIRQRLFLTGYAAGLRGNDPAAIQRALLEQSRAEQLLQRAWRYVD